MCIAVFVCQGLVHGWIRTSVTFSDSEEIRNSEQVLNLVYENNNFARKDLVLPCKQRKPSYQFKHDFTIWRKH